MEISGCTKLYDAIQIFPVILCEKLSFTRTKEHFERILREKYLKVSTELVDDFTMRRFVNFNMPNFFRVNNRRKLRWVGHVAACEIWSLSIVLYLCKKNTVLFIFLQVKPTQLGPNDRTSSCLRRCARLQTVKHYSSVFRIAIQLSQAYDI
jgi:hypothetical protein